MEQKDMRCALGTHADKPDLWGGSEGVRETSACKADSCGINTSTMTDFRSPTSSQTPTGFSRNSA